jgi:hypothetical protein
MTITPSANNLEDDFGFRWGLERLADGIEARIAGPPAWRRGSSSSVPGRQYGFTSRPRYEKR